MPTETKIFDLALALPHAVSCSLCVRRLMQALQERRGVHAVQLSAEGDKLMVSYDPALVAPDELAAALGSAGDAVSRRYRHERLTLTEMDCPECARTVESGLA